MAATTVNGISAYVLKVTGNVTKFVRVASMTAEEVAFIDAKNAAKGGSTLEDYLKTQSHGPTGQNAWARFGALAEEFDSAADKVIVSADAALAAAAPTKAEFDALVGKVNALQRLVTKLAAKVSV